MQSEKSPQELDQKIITHIPMRGKDLGTLIVLLPLSSVKVVAKYKNR